MHTVKHVAKAIAFSCYTPFSKVYHLFERN